jgi:hypothetical protein
MNMEEWVEIENRFDQLTPDDKLLVLERLIRRMRRAAFMDEADFAKEMQRMAADPDVQREFGAMRS